MIDSFNMTVDQYLQVFKHHKKKKKKKKKILLLSDYVMISCWALMIIRDEKDMCDTVAKYVNNVRACNDEPSSLVGYLYNKLLLLIVRACSCVLAFLLACLLACFLQEERRRRRRI